MTDFKDGWDLSMAFAVLGNEKIDAETWGEAVKWLLLYGPPEIRDVLSQASGMATRQYFPGIKPRGFNDRGEPLYEVADIAEALGISEEEAARQLNEMEFEDGVRYLFDKQESRDLQ